MAFYFRHDEIFEAALRRILKEQIAKAHRYLAFCDDGEIAVHGSRKCMKRLRALLRLFRPALCRSYYRQENARYRDIARLLSPSRDRQVMRDTVSVLREQVEGCKQTGKTKGLLAGLGEVEGLLAREQVMGSRGVDELRSVAVSKRHAIVLLDEAQEEITSLALTGRGFKVVGRGFAGSYRSGVRALDKARRSSDDDALHDLRKAVQTHWRHVALFARAWPEFFLFRVAAAKRISELLGQYRDLGLVFDFVAGRPSCEFSPKTVRSVLKYIKRCQRGRRAAALKEASLLFADDPKMLALQIRRYWDAAQDKTLSSGFKEGKSKGGSRRPSKARKTDPSKLPDGL